MCASGNSCWMISRMGFRPKQKRRDPRGQPCCAPEDEIMWLSSLKMSVLKRPYSLEASVPRVGMSSMREVRATFLLIQLNAFVKSVLMKNMSGSSWKSLSM